MSHYDIIVWLAATILFAVLEFCTTALVSIWFSIGCFAALLAALMNFPLVGQIFVFIFVTTMALVITWPIANKLLKSKTTPTNADRIIGQTAKVTETIDNENSKGAVYADGKSWTARSTDGSIISEGTLVQIEKIDGVKLFVTQATEN